jgi:C-terminal processing protease CtpA/Prc
MLSADPDLLPWDLKEIITSTATDVGPDGVDVETGHGLINCYRAVKEVLRRKAIREGTDPTLFAGRVAGDEIDVQRYRESLAQRVLVVGAVVANSPAAKAGLKRGDIIVELIVEFNRVPIESEAEFRKLIKTVQGESVEIRVLRGRKKLALTQQSVAKGIGRMLEEYKSPVFE